MKQFNLKEYMNNPNRKVVTKDGKKVRIICTDRNSIYPVIALVNNGCEDIYTYNEKGVDAGISKLNLFFAPEKREGWMNIYKISNGLIGRRVYGSKEEAEKNIADNYGYITTCKIEWEEYK